LEKYDGTQGERGLDRWIEGWKGIDLGSRRGVEGYAIFVYFEI
jgi:hypothetical protein